jgi:hypothetical protein
MSAISPSEWIDERTEILRSSDEPGDLTTAAAELASADDPAALDALGPFLRDPNFLARLDDAADPAGATEHLRPVLTALVQRASPEIVPLCLSLANDRAFLSDPDRKSFLLEALAGVTPMTAESAEIFRVANPEGYFAFNARLLAENASPVALGLFLAMMLDSEEEVETRVEILHMSLVPVRNRVPIMELVGRLAAKNPGEAIVNAAIESVYDFQVTWRKGHPAPPPPWRTASSESLKYLVTMAPYLKKHFPLPRPLQAAMDQTTETASQILARRNA